MNLSIYSLPFLIAFQVNLILGLIILSNNFKNSTNRLLGLLILLFALWNLGDFALTVSNSEAHAKLIGRIIWTITAFFPGIYIHFALTFPRKRKIALKPVVVLLIYLPSVILVYITWLTKHLIIGTQPTYWSQFYFSYGPAINIYTLYYSICFVVGSILFYWVFVKSPSTREKLQSKWFLLASIVPIIGGVISNMLMPMTGNYIFPIAAPLTSFMAIMMAYAILRYKIVSVTQQNSAEIILSMLPGVVALLDTEQNIIKANKRFYEVLGYAETELAGQPISVVLSDKDRNAGLAWHKWDENLSINFQKTELKTKDGKPIAINYSGLIMSDKIEDITGLVFLGLTEFRSETKQ